jgi:hypothetical protein
MTEQGVAEGTRERLYNKHDKIRKQSGLPDPKEYEKIIQQKKKEIADLKAQREQGVAEDASIERKEGFRGRTTPDVEYIVRDENGNIVRVCKTKKEARMWYDMVTLSKEEMFVKYPELRVNENSDQVPVSEDYLDEK